MYSSKYDDAVDKCAYYSDIYDKLNFALMTIRELGDETFDTETIKDNMSYADDKMREYRDIINEIEKTERKSSKAGIPCYDM